MGEKLQRGDFKGKLQKGVKEKNKLGYYTFRVLKISILSLALDVYEAEEASKTVL